MKPLRLRRDLEIRPTHVDLVAFTTRRAVPLALGFTVETDAVEVIPLDGTRSVVAANHVAVRNLQVGEDRETLLSVVFVIDEISRVKRNSIVYDVYMVHE